jgi:hypothetical protein
MSNKDLQIRTYEFQRVNGGTYSGVGYPHEKIAARSDVGVRTKENFAFRVMSFNFDNMGVTKMFRHQKFGSHKVTNMPINI